VPAHKLEECLELIDVCVSGPDLSEEAINKERQIILNELANDEGEFWHRISRRVLGDCAINCSGIGTPDTIKRIRREQIEAFFRNNYVLNKMTLVCVGDIEFNVLQDLITKKIVRLRNNNARRENYRCPEGKEGFIKIKEPCAKNSILYGFRVPGYKKQSKEFYVLWFLQDYLQDALFSFVREKGLSYTMSVTYNINNFSGLFQFYIRYIKKGRKAVMKKIEEAIENLRSNLIEPDDFEKFKLSTINQYLNYLKDQKELADVYQQYADIYEDIGEIKDDVNELQSLTPGDIKAVVGRYFIKDRAFLAAAGMYEQILDTLWPFSAVFFVLGFIARFSYPSLARFNKILILITALSSGIIIWLLIERKRLLRLIEDIQRESTKT
ncbi:MAG: insulinase family protein, partial [Candidatus Omnitrophota bacterium]